MVPWAGLIVVFSDHTQLLFERFNDSGMHLVRKRQHESKKEGKDQDRYNQAPYLTKDTNGKVTTSQFDITNESQEVSPFPAGDRKA